MAQRSTGHVFMSYSRRDDLSLRRVVAFLRKQGIKVWMDHEQLEPGTPIWEEEIEKGIRGASAIVVLMSPDSKTSEWVRREISYSEQYRKRIFPVLVAGDEESSITLRLITRQYVDIRQAEEEGLRLLGATLLAYLEELNIEERNAEERQAIRLTTSETGEINKETRVVTPGLSELPKFSQQTETSPHKWSSILWGTLGWAIAGAIGGFLYWTAGDYSVIIAGVFSGAIGGLATAITLYVEHILSNRKSILWITLAWAIGVAIGWTIGDALTEAIGAAIGGAIAAAIGTVITSRMDHVLSDWKRIAWITLAWAISWAIGWTISRYFQLNLDAGATGWTIGIAISAAIGGFVTIWQIREEKKK